MIDPLPVGRTARRLEWSFLPPHLRTLVERHCGSPVVRADSQGAGFTPGFASVLTCADGTRHFVKAASTRAQRLFADSYREEGRKLARLPRSVPAPRLLWTHDDDWVVLGIQYVAGRNPTRPWRADELDATLDALEVVARELTPPPPGLSLDTVEAELGGFVAAWDHVRATRSRLRHAEEAAELAASFAEGARGGTLVHTDVRDDNVLLDREGRVWFCDWNWPVTGAAWLDSLFTLIGPRGDGLDVERVIAERALFDGVPAEHLDAVLALLVGYFLKQGDEPVPPTSPYLRRHQQSSGDVCWDWLCERRGWS